MDASHARKTVFAETMGQCFAQAGLHKVTVQLGFVQITWKVNPTLNQFQPVHYAAGVGIMLIGLCGGVKNLISEEIGGCVS